MHGKWGSRHGGVDETACPISEAMGMDSKEGEVSTTVEHMANGDATPRSLDEMDTS